MANIDEVGRPEPPLAAGEAEAALGFLDFQRATLEWKCAGVDAAGLRAMTAASTMTLAGLLKHIAWVEDYWFSYRLLGRPPSAPWDTVDWAADGNWEWNSALTDEPSALLALWHDNVERARAAVATALAGASGGAGFDTIAARPSPGGESPNLRWIVLHMIEEYARHNGHADLLREAIDGSTGE